MSIKTTLLLLPFFVLPLILNAQEDLELREFIMNIQRCIKLKSGEQPEKELSMIYFEVKKRDSLIVLTHVIGEHENVIYNALRKAIECTKFDIRSDRIFRCLLLIGEMKSRLKPYEEQVKERDKRIEQFKSQYKLKGELEIIEVFFGRPIR